MLLLLLLLVWIRRWDFFIETAGQVGFDNFELDLHFNLTVSCKASLHLVRLGLLYCSQGLICVFLLILSGDISTNPGPSVYPCTVCSHSVHRNHRALQCDSCQLWSHINCVSVSSCAYELLCSMTEFSWQCPSCLFSALPSFDACDDSSAEFTSSCADDSLIEHNDCGGADSTADLLGAVVHGVRIVHHNIQGINFKLLELSQWFEASGDSSTIYCFTETWLKPHSSTLTVSGFTVFTSPLLHRPGQEGSYLPGSCMVVPDSVIVH